MRRNAGLPSTIAHPDTGSEQPPPPPSPSLQGRGQRKFLNAPNPEIPRPTRPGAGGTASRHGRAPGWRASGALRRAAGPRPVPTPSPRDSELCGTPFLQPLLGASKTWGRRTQRIGWRNPQTEPSSNLNFLFCLRDSRLICQKVINSQSRFSQEACSFLFFVFLAGVFSDRAEHLLRARGTGQTPQGTRVTFPRSPPSSRGAASCELRALRDEARAPRSLF